MSINRLTLLNTLSVTGLQRICNMTTGNRTEHFQRLYPGWYTTHFQIYVVLKVLDAVLEVYLMPPFYTDHESHESPRIDKC